MTDKSRFSDRSAAQNGNVSEKELRETIQRLDESLREELAILAINPHALRAAKLLGFIDADEKPTLAGRALLRF